ncbi:hypothetical protein HYY74_02290 [Candidatus Woesearchaeota archaeon]|nr:hypothetical protein [Candidatus Woesearchaeota archaeon]
MMSRPTLHFSMVFDKTADRFDDFMEFLNRRFGNDLTIGKRHRRAKYNSRAARVGLSVDTEKMSGEKVGAPFSIGFGVLRNPGISVLGLSAEIGIPETFDNPVYKMFVDLFFEACRKFSPRYGSGYERGWGISPLTDTMEFYSDPYLFCVEPPSNNGKFGWRNLNRFFDSASTKSKLLEIRKVLGRRELVSLLREHAGRVDVSRAGVGVYKDDVAAGQSILLPEVCPRFFVRREVKRRGVSLDWGWTEEFAVLFSVHRRDKIRGFSWE